MINSAKVLLHPKCLQVSVQCVSLKSDHFSNVTAGNKGKMLGGHMRRDHSLATQILHAEVPGICSSKNQAESDRKASAQHNIELDEHIS